jgi:hypothetical protein
LRGRAGGGDEQHHHARQHAAVGVDPQGEERGKCERPAPVSGVDLLEQPEFHDERQRGEDLRARGEAVGNFPNGQRAECPGDGPGTRSRFTEGLGGAAAPLRCHRNRNEERQQPGGSFQQQQSRAAQGAMRQTQRGFGDDFVVDPAMAGRRPRIGLGAREVAGLQKFLAEQDVPPQVSVNGVVGETKNREAKDAEDERAAQQGMGWRGWHGGKVAAAGGKKSFFVRQRKATP